MMFVLNRDNIFIRILSLILIFCLAFCVCFSPVTHAFAVETFLTITSIGVFLLSLFGWTVDQQKSTAAQFEQFFQQIGQGAVNLWHQCIGDYAAYYLKENGQLSQELIDLGWHYDSSRQILSFNGTQTDGEGFEYSVQKYLDFAEYKSTGKIKWIMPSNLYSEIWYQVQEYMHSPNVTLKNFVRVRDEEPTLDELRSEQVIYLGNIKDDGYFFNLDNASFYIPNGYDCLSPVINYCYAYGYRKKGESNLTMFIEFNYGIFQSISSSEKIALSPFYYIRSGNQYYLHVYCFSYDSDFKSYCDFVCYNQSSGYGSISCDRLVSRPNSFDSIVDSISGAVSVNPVKSNAVANANAGTVTGDDGKDYPVTAPGQAGSIPINSGVVSGTLTNPVTGVKGSDYVSGKSDALNGTVTVTGTVAESGVSVDSISSTATMDFPEGLDKWIPDSVLFQKFPFCIPFDLVTCFTCFYSNKKDFRWEIPFKISSLNINEKITIDLTSSTWDFIFIVVRYLLLAMFVFWLISKTRGLVRG